MPPIRARWISPSGETDGVFDGQVKIEQHRRAVGRQQDIGRLQVAMEQSPLVQRARGPRRVARRSSRRLDGAGGPQKLARRLLPMRPGAARSAGGGAGRTGRTRRSSSPRNAMPSKMPEARATGRPTNGGRAVAGWRSTGEDDASLDGDGGLTTRGASGSPGRGP